MEQNKEAAWFENWFDTSWYHTLYQDRNETEAEGFVASLMKVLDLPVPSNLLDLACGKGRHSIFLHSLGHKVLGVDLSANSISLAKPFEEEGLRFRTGDMRQAQGNEEFDLVLNLFTSFGYFGSEEENLKVLTAIKTSLKPGGLLLVDFMNTARVVQNLVPESETVKGGIHFSLKRSLEDGNICKRIGFEADGKKHNFMEQVQAISKDDFLRYFEKTGFEIVLLSGDYNMAPFDENGSERMIFLLRKPS